MTLTGDPDSVSSEPACAANARGSSSWLAGSRSRTAITTTTGSRAATAPFTLMSAVSPAARSIVSTRRRVRLSATRATSSSPAHAVTPVASRLSLTTNSEAMKITAGSPKPATAWFRSSTPVAHRRNAAPTATTATGSRWSTTTPITAARTRNVIVWWLTAAWRAGLGVNGRPGPERDPEQVPGDEEERPGDGEDHDVREHERDHRADARVLLV